MNEQLCAHSVNGGISVCQTDGGGSSPTCALQIEAAVPAATMKLQPTTLRKANDFVAEHHRHNGRTARNGGKWACSVEIDGKTVGVAIVGNPISATLMDGYTAEVLRVCTIGSAAKGACSMLYMACWRAWKAMGGRRMITYTLESEPGASLRGAGWKVVGKTKPCKPGWRKKEDQCNRTYSPVMGLVKNRWQKNA